LTPFVSLTLPDFVVLFDVLDRKFNEDSNNVFKTVIFSLQVDFAGHFFPDYPLNRVTILDHNFTDL